MVDIFEGKILYLVENIMSQVFGIACCCVGCHITGLYAEKQCKHCHHNQNDSSLYDVAQITLGDTDINDLGHLQGDQNFHQNLQDYQKRCQNGLLFVFPDGT